MHERLDNTKVAFSLTPSTACYGHRRRAHAVDNRSLYSKPLRSVGYRLKI